MIKNKLDFKLINIALISIICYFVFMSLDFWLNIINKIISVIIPLILSFALAYTIDPIVKYLNKFKIPKTFGIFIVLIIIIFIIILFVIMLFPFLKTQIISLFNYIIVFVKNMNIQNEYLNNIISDITTYLPSSIFKTIDLSIDLISKFILILISSIYFLLDMDKIKLKLKEKLSNNFYNYLKLIDIELKKYISGFLKIVFISFFEYTIFYYIIGHPNFLLLGILASISNFIPYFGGMIVQIISVITALVISNSFGLKVAIFSLLLGLFDTYILNTLVYGKTNELHPLIVITSVFIGGALFGFFGVILSLPITIILINTYKFFKK